MNSSSVALLPVRALTSLRLLEELSVSVTFPPNSKKATSTSDPAEAQKAIQEMVTVHKNNVWVIGLVGEDPVPYVVSNHMHNVPDNFVQDEAFREEGLAQPAQFFLDNGATWLTVGTILQRSPVMVEQLLARFREHLNPGTFLWK